MVGRAGFHRRLRGIPRAEVPDLHRIRLCGARIRDRQRRDVCRAGALLGDRPSSDDPVHPPQIQAGPGAGRLPNHG